MANYHLSSSIISRAAGKSVVASAAYRACTQLNDKSIGIEFNYSNKRDLVFSEIISPPQSPAWVSERERLWNEVESVEKRKDSQLAREVEVSLPLELTTEQHIDLIREYVNENFINKGMIADINIHNKDGNPHAHVLLTQRIITPEGFGQKERSWNNRSLIHTWRKSWADIQNQHLSKAGFDISVDHRSYKDQGIDLEPQIHLGPLHQMDSSTVKQHDRMEEYKRISLENGNRIIDNPTIAINHLSKNQAVFTDYDILKCANLYSYDEEQYNLVKTAIETHPELIYLGTYDDKNKKYTSLEMLKAEEKMFANIANIKEIFNHSVNDKFIQQAAAQKTMTEEQENAFNYVLKDSDISVIEGVAGAGKSYVLGSLKDAYEAQGYNVEGCALSGIASEGLQDSTGIKSKTVTKLLWEWSHDINTFNKDSILVVEEAGMIGTKQMHRLIDHVQKMGSKVVIVGDTEQTQAIAAGGAFRGIKERVKPVRIENVFRQEIDWQKHATIEFSSTKKEHIESAIDIYNDNGFVKFSDTYDSAKEKLINEWSDSIINNSDQTNFILAYKRDDVKELNIKARERMKEMDRLGKIEYEYLNQESISDNEPIEIKSESEISYKTTQGTLPLSVNDRVMFTKNNNSIGVKNGSIGTVHGIRKNQLSVQLDSGKTVVFDTRDYKDITYGYASTINKSQGITVDRTFTLGSTLFDKHLTYVAMSRHRKETNLYVAGGNESKEKYCFKNYGHLTDILSRDRSKDLVVDYADLRGIEPPEEKIFTSEEIKTVIEEIKTTTEITKPVEETTKDIVKDTQMSIEKLKAEAKEFLNQTQKEGKGGFVEAMKDIHKNSITPGQRVDELEKFKTQINLSEYASHKGYVYDRKQSYQNVIVMRNDHDKINISEGPDGRWLYYSRATEKGGSIIDFVQAHDGKNLGEVRKELRPWIGEASLKPYVPEINYQKEAKPVAKNRSSVLAEFNAAVETNKLPYLETRGIEKIDQRFQGKVFTDKYNNAVFPHIDREGVCCLEKRNHEFKGMSKGGEKGLWVSHTYKGDNRLIIVEAPIDGLSYHELHGTEKTRYIGFGGEMQEKQQELLKSAINRMPDNSKIILATDQGEAGDKFADRIKEMQENKTHEFIRHAPTMGNDWNAELTNIKGINQAAAVKEKQNIKGFGIGL